MSLSVTGVSPMRVQAGQLVYVHGSGFAVGATTVEAFGKKIAAHVYDETQLSFRLPDFIHDESYVAVCVNDRWGMSHAVIAAHVPSAKAPLVGAVTPAIVKAGSKTWLYVRGDRFVLDQTTVAIDKYEAIGATVYAHDQIGFELPPLTVGAYAVTVSTPYGATESKAKVHVTR